VLAILVALGCPLNAKRALAREFGLVPCGRGLVLRTGKRLCGMAESYLNRSILRNKTLIIKGLSTINGKDGAIIDATACCQWWTPARPLFEPSFEIKDSPAVRPGALPLLYSRHRARSHLSRLAVRQSLLLVDHGIDRHRFGGAAAECDAQPRWPRQRRPDALGPTYRPASAYNPAFSDRLSLCRTAHVPDVAVAIGTKVRRAAENARSALGTPLRYARMH
jgi:hypothetical protein